MNHLVNVKLGYRPNFNFLSDLEVVLFVGAVIVVVVVPGGKQSQLSLPLNLDWIWIGLDRIWLEFDNDKLTNYISIILENF